MTTIVAPIDTDLDLVAETDPQALESLDVFAVLESLPLYNNNVLLGYGIPNTVEGVPTGFIEPLGGAQGGDPNASTDVADALASDPSKTLYNYMEVYLFEADSVFDFAQSLDYLNTVIGVGPGLIDAVIVQTGNGTGTDLTTPIVVNAEEAANDTKVLAVTATSYYVAGGSAGAITAAPGADLALEVADSAANIAADLPTILQSMKGYTDFVRLYLDLDDTGENIAGSLLSIEKSLDTISSTANAFFESNDTGNYDYVTVAMNSSDTGSLIPFTVGQYQQVFEDPAFYNIFTGVGAAAPHTIEIIDTAANIEGLSTLLFLPPARQQRRLLWQLHHEDRGDGRPAAAVSESRFGIGRFGHRRQRANRRRERARLGAGDRVARRRRTIRCSNPEHRGARRHADCIE